MKRLTSNRERSVKMWFPGALAPLLCWAALLCAGTGVDSRAAEPGFEAGFADVDITPPTGWRRAGNYTELVSTGVNDPLYAKAMVLAQGKTLVALVGNDLCSVPRELTERARRLASAKTGIPAGNIIITATHTHGGPEYYGPLRDFLHARAMKENDGKDPREPIDYQARLVEKWVEVIQQALNAKKPADLSVVVPEQHGLAFNRRFLMKDGTTGWIPARMDTNIFRPLGPTDPELPFVLFRQAEDRKPLGSLTVFAMHSAIYGGPPFGACYPGHLQKELRHRLEAPDLVSIFGEGCAGDVNHIDSLSPPPADEGNYPQQVAARLAQTIHEALPYARTIKPGLLAVRSETVYARVKRLAPGEYEAARTLMENLDRAETPFLTTVDAWRKMFQQEYWTKYKGRLPQEVQAIRLDADTAIVTLPHEVFVELGMAIKAGSPFRTTLVISLANDLDFYIPTRRAFEEGHYEPTTCPLEPGCGELLVKTAVNLLDALKP